MRVVRLAIVQHGPIRFGVDGADTAGHDSPDERARDAPAEVVAVARPSHVRIITEAGAVRLLLWVARAHLARVTTHRSTLSLPPDSAPPSHTGVTVDAGFAIDAVDGAQAYFQHHDHAIRFRGWLPLAEVDEVYEPSPPVSAPAPDTLLRAGAVILSKPGGQEIARVVSNRELGVHRIEGRSDDHVLIEYRGETFAVRGYVQVGNIAPPAQRAADPVGGWGTGQVTPQTVPIELPRDTCLYGAGVDEPIGVITRKLITHDVVAGDDGAWHLRLWTKWGELELGLRPLDRTNPPSQWQRCPWNEASE